MGSHLDHGEWLALLHRKSDALFETGDSLQSKAGLEDGAMKPVAEDRAERSHRIKASLGLSEELSRVLFGGVFVC
jgi:hypothetical protein